MQYSCVFCTKLKTEKARRSPHPVLVRHVKLFQLFVIIRNLTDIHFVVSAVVVFLCYFNCICKLSGVWRSVLVFVCTKKDFEPQR